MSTADTGLGSEMRLLGYKWVIGLCHLSDDVEGHFLTRVMILSGHMWQSTRQNGHRRSLQLTMLSIIIYKSVSKISES